MSRLRDEIDQLERRLDKDGLDHLGRRLLLREVFGHVREKAFADGYQEGMCDAMDAQHAKDRAAELAAGEGEER